MKFTATKWIERNYKTLSWISVILVSLFVVWYYFAIEDKTDMFIPSTLYALFLYIVGVFNSNLASRIDALFLNRVDVYLNLKRAEELFNTISPSTSHSQMRDNISWFRAFTARLPQKDAPKVRYIKEKGVTFNHKKLKIEEKYLTLYTQTMTILQHDISKFVNDNNITTQKPNLVIDDCVLDSIKDWCEGALLIDDSNRSIIDAFIKQELQITKQKVSKLSRLKRKINNLYSNYKKKTDKSIKAIQTMYGAKLSSYLEQENGWRTDIEFYLEQIENMKNEIISYVEHNDDKLDTCSDKLDDTSNDLKTLFDMIKDSLDEKEI